MPIIFYTQTYICSDYNYIKFSNKDMTNSMVVQFIDAVGIMLRDIYSLRTISSGKIYNFLQVATIYYQQGTVSLNLIIHYKYWVITSILLPIRYKYINYREYNIDHKY